MITIGWHGLPAYAARLIQAGRESLPEKIEVIASRPSVPIEGMETILHNDIHWIDAADPNALLSREFNIPRLYVQPSWAFKAFNSFGRAVAHAGGRVVLMF